MEQEFFTIKQSSLMKALLYGHLMNIALGVVVFGSLHWLFGYSLELSVVATIISTILVGVLVSVAGTRKLSRPITALHRELNDLHEKVNQSNSALSSASQSSQALLEDLPIGFLVFNKKTELIQSNQRAFTLLGFKPDEAPVTQTVLEVLKNLQSNGKTVAFTDWITQSKDKIHDSQRWPMVSTQANPNASAFDVMVHYNSHDSHNYELVVLLIDRSEEYGRQEKQMEFISLAAHELRGPITIMRGLIDILQDETTSRLSEEHKKLLLRMAVSSRQLAGYVDNILSVSRIDKEGFEVQSAETNWPSLVERTMKDLSVRAQAHHRKIELHVPQNLPTVAADSAVILHVINNLVDNAIKYSPENGSIVVTAKLKGDVVETTIQDFGIGIPENVVDNLFTKFYRSHRSKQFVTGTGLGLYLSKAIIEAHGGNIWVRSTEGAGTTFGFTLPTYQSVASQVKASDNEEGIVRGSHGWIKNHALYRR